MEQLGERIFGTQQSANFEEIFDGYSTPEGDRCELTSGVTKFVQALVACL